MSTTIRHNSERTARLIETGRLDGSPSWSQQFDGDRKAAEKWVRDWYGKAGRVERSTDSTCLRYVGFTIHVIGGDRG